LLPQISQVKGENNAIGARRGTGNNNKAINKPSAVLIQQIELNKKKYLYIESTQWHLNKYTLPITLKVEPETTFIKIKKDAIISEKHK